MSMHEGECLCVPFNRIAAVMISYVVPPTAEPKSKLLSLSAPSKERCVAKKQ